MFSKVRQFLTDSFSQMPFEIPEMFHQSLCEIIYDNGVKMKI